MIRVIPRLLPLAFSLALALRPAPVLAQARQNPNEPAQVEASSESSGDPMYGYVATGFLAFGAMFAVCRSARR
jgi:hypothetical protein